MNRSQLWRLLVRALSGAGLAASLMGCTDEPVCITPRGGGAPAQLLSELHLFSGGGGAALTPADSLVAYDVKVPLYADGSVKHRFIALPPGAKLKASSDRW